MSRKTGVGIEEEGKHIGRRMTELGGGVWRISPSHRNSSALEYRLGEGQDPADVSLTPWPKTWECQDYTPFSAEMGEGRKEAEGGKGERERREETAAVC